MGRIRKATLTRFETGPDGTFGKLVTDNGFSVYTVERPWADNRKEESCIKSGSYKCVMQHSPRFGDCYHLLAVPGRTDILIHSANWARQLKGCIAPGRAIGDVMGMKGVMSSKDALTGLEADLDKEPFTLVVSWESGLGQKEA